MLAGYSRKIKVTLKFCLFLVSGGFLVNRSENFDHSFNHHSPWSHRRLSLAGSSGKKKDKCLNKYQIFFRGDKNVKLSPAIIIRKVMESC